MAFPVPSHLPRKKDPQDISTRILTKISEVTTKTLDVQLASSWVAELDDTITQTKRRIHDRIADDLPAFERQMSAAKSIQERLNTLTGNVDILSSSLSDPETGLIPTLITTLTKYSALSQETADAGVKYNALSHILRCRDDFLSLSQLVHEGRLPEAVSACKSFEQLLGEAPAAFSQSTIMLELKKSFTAMQARTEEQLNDAYVRSIHVSASEFVIRPSIQVRQSETVLPLPSVLSALSGASLTSQLTSLRRDINAFYIEHLLKQPAAVSVTSANDMTEILEHKLSLIPSPPDSATPASRLENLSTVLTFLNANLFPHLPKAERMTFPYSLCKPVRAAVLSHLLIPSLPSSLDKLQKYLELTHQAAAFEEEYIGAMLGDNSASRDIKVWVNNVGLHYERKRRVELLESARVIILGAEDEGAAFHVDFKITTEPESAAAPTVIVVAPKAPPEPIEEESEAAWGFEEDQPTPKEDTGTTDENGWGFDDDLDPEPELEPAAEPELESEAPPQPEPNEEAEDDTGDAWGWNDDEGSLTAADDSIGPWDDGWNNQSGEPSLSAKNGAAKPAKRLEKFTSKGGSDADASAPRSPPLVGPPPPTPVVPPAPRQNGRPAPVIIKESYVVSGRTKELIRLVEDVLAEGAELASCGILSAHASSSSPSGTLILQAAPMTLELYRALYPVTALAELVSSPRRSMRFSNDCLYISGEVQWFVRSLKASMLPARDSLIQCEEAMKLLGDSWFGETIDRQNASINELLDKAQGFVDTTDQNRFDECEDAVNKALQRIRQFAQQLKTTLNKSKYYLAIGSAVDAALSRILTDALALPDITEVESHRLSELCRILNALEGLFVENPEQPSFVVSYVPSWLKFSYLSELLEASIADISYLFEEGALVDFEIDELVKLIRALFADTPLRTNTINKLLKGHPAQS